MQAESTSDVPESVLDRGIAGARAAAALLAVLAVALLTEVWLRVGILPWVRRGTARWHRTWNREVRGWGVRTVEAARLCAGLKVEVRGTVPASGRYLVVSNHQSSIDIPFLIHVLRPLNLKFVAHDGLEHGKPAVSVGLRCGGSAFVGKRNAREDLRRLRRFAEDLAANDGSPVIFPEGIRSFDGTMGTFQMAGTRTVREISGLPILPVVHDGLWRARTIRGAHRLIGCTIRFRVLAPIAPERFEKDGRSAYLAVEETIREELTRMRSE